MKVELLHIESCPGHAHARVRLRAALDDLGLAAVEVQEQLVRTSEQAAETSFAGSPTILVDGEDLFPTGQLLLALACRVYPTNAGLADCPTQAQLVEALRARTVS
ncbi:hypothetical protein [Demequina iriomotensis]|uniref:hypothetical protein n=1 Tax=Demequina iriomotensis TaxID=1536641 RepID=UPI00078223EB|nr:hypothetical protein [Demequina iriomotensis]